MYNKKIKLEIKSDTTNERLDKFLSEHPDLDLTRNKIQKLIDENLVLVNDKPVNKKYIPVKGDVIKIDIPDLEPSEITPENIPLDIVYEDEHLAVINKPAGLVTHPGAANFSGTLVNAIMYRLQNLPQSSPSDRPGIVHRLDKNTSGLLVVAKTDKCLALLQDAIHNRKVKRTYLALVCGHVQNETGEIDLPIGRSLKDRKKMTVTNINSREAKTSYKLLKRYRSYDYLEVNLHTGRTHQIRVHFSHLGHPVFGDPEYGGRQKWLKGMFAPERPLTRQLLDVIERQALHAARLEFVHPEIGEEMKFFAEIPEDIKEVLRLLDEEGA